MVKVESDEIKSAYHLNALDLLDEIRWFEQVVQTRLKIHYGEDCEVSSIFEIAAPVLLKKESVYAEFIRFYQLSVSERLILILALLPHVCPQVLDIFLSSRQTGSHSLTEFGGLKAVAHSGFIPT